MEVAGTDEGQSRGIRAEGRVDLGRRVTGQEDGLAVVEIEPEEITGDRSDHDRAVRCDDGGEPGAGRGVDVPETGGNGVRPLFPQPVHGPGP